VGSSKGAALTTGIIAVKARASVSVLSIKRGISSLPYWMRKGPMLAWIWHQPGPSGIERTAMEFLGKGVVCLCGVLPLAQRMSL
jgi:hypothetical protein